MGTTNGGRGNPFSIWAWGALVGETEDVCVEIETQGIEVRGCIIMRGKVGGVDGTNFGSGTGDVRGMEFLYCSNRLQRYVIASRWVLQVL